MRHSFISIYIIAKLVTKNIHIKISVFSSFSGGKWAAAVTEKDACPWHQLRRKRQQQTEQKFRETTEYNLSNILSSVSWRSAPPGWAAEQTWAASGNVNSDGKYIFLVIFM